MIKIEAEFGDIQVTASIEASDIAVLSSQVEIKKFVKRVLDDWTEIVQKLLKSAGDIITTEVLVKSAVKEEKASE